jgi:Ala-tRNA(Pro) deacylase
MMMSDVVKTYLNDRGIDYQLSAHRKTATSRQSAAAAHVKANQVAKAVLMNHGGEYLMVVVPADSRVDNNRIDREMGTHYQLAPQNQVESMLDDCVPGAIPPIGRAYGVETLVDDSLASLTDVYFEAGDHEHLIHVSGIDFHKLLSDCRHGQYSIH